MFLQIRNSLGIFFFLLCFAACKKRAEVVPSVPADFTIYLNLPDFIKLNSAGGSVYVSGGVKGILVYRVSNDEFAAYDRDCPYDPNVSNAIVQVDSSGILAIDYNCGSQFNLINGDVLRGPAAYSLKRYAADYDGVSTVHVHN